MALYTTISVSPSSHEINGTNAFTVSISYSITASRLINTKVTVAGQTYSIGTVTGTSFTWTPPLALLNSMPSLSSATVTITGTPANNNNTSLVGEISTYCTVTVPASYVPTAPTGVTLTRVDNGVPPSWGVYVQNKSRLNVSWAAASGTGGATISQYRIYTDTGSGYYTATGTSIANLGPFTAGMKTVTVVAVDSRGRTATSSGVAYEVQPYSVPGVSKQKVDRTTATGVVDNLGTYMKANVTWTFASVGGKNSAAATFAWKTTGSSIYSAETTIAQSTDRIFGGSFSSLTAYHVRFTITDALGSVTTYVATVESLKIALEFEANSNRLWMHCPLTMNADATFNNLITSGGNSHLMLNGLSYISLRTGGMERGYFHSGGLHVPGTISCASLSVTNAVAFSTVTCDNLAVNNLLTSGSGSHLYLRGTTYVSLQTGTTERGYFHSGGLIVHGTINCTNLTVTNPPWPTGSTLPANPTFTTVNASQAGSSYQIEGFNALDVGSNGIRWSTRMNYGRRLDAAATVYGADYIQFFIGNSERAYCSASGMNNSSLVEQKTEIQDAGAALAVIRDAQLYQYRYADTIEKDVDVADGQPATDQLSVTPTVNCQPSTVNPSPPTVNPQPSTVNRLGFVIGEGYDPPPACVLAEDGRGVNIYAMASVCWRGLQELLIQVNEIQQKIGGI